MKPSYRMEPLSETLQVCVSPEHGFGTDAFLLTDFSRYRRKDLVCDLGTGCGIIPMIMQRQDPPKQVYGVDIQPQAIEQFQQSVQAGKRRFACDADLCRFAHALGRCTDAVL